MLGRETMMSRSTSGKFLRHPAVLQLIRYGAVVGSGYLLAISLYSVELAISIAPYPALGIAFVSNGIYNFALIRYWAFPRSGRRVHSDLFRFCVVAAISFGVNYASFAVLYSVVCLSPQWSQRAAIVIAAPFTFMFNRLWAFRNSTRPSAPDGWSH